MRTTYEMRISDWSADVCSSDLPCLPSACPGPWPRAYQIDAVFAATQNTVRRQRPHRGAAPVDRSGAMVILRRMAEPPDLESLARRYIALRSEERRVGHACVSTCRSR